MKALLKSNYLLVIAMSLCYSVVNAQTYVFTEPADGVTVIEAEHYYELRANPEGMDWAVSTDFAGYLDDGYMMAPPDISYGDGAIAQADAPAIIYKVNFTTTGVHYFFARCSYANGNSDSYWLGIGDIAFMRMNPYSEMAENFDTWGWHHSTTTEQSQFNIEEAGEYDVVVYQREQNFRLDKIVITTDPNTGPMGFDETGPDETMFVTGVNETYLSNSLRIFPNPTGTFTNITFEVLERGDLKASIYNLTGQLVKVLMDDEVVPGYRELSWDVTASSNVSSGIYFLKIDHAGGTAVRKIIVE